MLLSLARDVLLGALSQVLGNAATDVVRGANGSVTVPLALLEDALDAHVQVVSDSRQAIRELAEAVRVLQQNHQLMIVEAPSIAVQVPAVFFVGHELAASGPALSANVINADSMDKRHWTDKQISNDGASGESDAADQRGSVLRTRLRDAYPTTNLEFF